MTANDDIPARIRAIEDGAKNGNLRIHICMLRACCSCGDRWAMLKDKESERESVKVASTPKLGTLAFVT